MTRIDPDGALRPGLAVSWENDGHTVWQFNLRSGATFHNGTPVTAEGIADNINELLTPALAGLPIATEMRTIASAVARDDSTVDIVTHEPDPMLAKRLSLLRIVDMAEWRRLGMDEFARAPVGSGPFRFESWNDGGAIILPAFAGSWRSSKSIGGLRIFTLKDSIARTQALLADQIDIALGLTPEDAEIIEGAGLRSHVHFGNQVMAIGLPNALKADSPLNHAAVRQAMNLAVNRDAIVDFILGGLFPKASQGATRSNVGYNADLVPYDYDPARARVLLAEAGYPDGFDLVIEVLVGMGPSDSLIYQQVAQDLSAVGIRAELRTSTYPERTRKYFSGDWGDVDAFSILWNNAPYNDTARALSSFSCLKVNPFFCDEEIAARIAASEREMSPDRRTADLQAIMADMHDLAPAINLIEYGSIIGHTADVSNIAVRPVGVAYEDFVLSR